MSLRKEKCTSTVLLVACVLHSAAEEGQALYTTASTFVYGDELLGIGVGSVLQHRKA